jgi:hypothetical protein
MSIKQNYQNQSDIDDSNRPPKVDSHRAKSIARIFLEQYYPITIFKGAILYGNIWTVAMDVGLVRNEIIQIRIDAKTGKILDYS